MHSDSLLATRSVVDTAKSTPSFAMVVRCEGFPVDVLFLICQQRAGMV